jgi:hypothetical protein
LASHGKDDVINVAKDAEREATKWWTQENRQGCSGKAAPVNRAPIDLAYGAYIEVFHPISCARLAFSNCSAAGLGQSADNRRQLLQSKVI